MTFARSLVSRASSGGNDATFEILLRICFAQPTSTAFRELGLGCAEVDGDAHWNAVFALAEQVGLSERLVRRLTQSDSLAARLPVRLLQKERARIVGRAVQANAALQAVGDVARAPGIPWVPLKGAALFERFGASASYWRVGTDVDLLAPEDDAHRLWEALRQAGFRRAYSRGPAHHLPALHHRRYGAVEVHQRLHGMSLDGAPKRSRYVTWADLAKHGQLGGNRLGRSALAAHLTVHALVQHRWTPEQYTRLLLLSDLADLQPFSHDEREQVLRWLPEGDARRGFEEALSLLGTLRAGMLPREGAEYHLLRRLQRGGQASSFSLRAARPFVELFDPQRRTVRLLWLKRHLMPSRARLRRHAGRRTNHMVALLSWYREGLFALVRGGDWGRSSRKSQRVSTDPQKND